MSKNRVHLTRTLPNNKNQFLLPTIRKQGLRLFGLIAVIKKQHVCAPLLLNKKCTLNQN
jgi:hypothetical protein